MEKGNVQNTQINRDLSSLRISWRLPVGVKAEWETTQPRFSVTTALHPDRQAQVVLHSDEKVGMTSRGAWAEDKW